MSPPSNVKRLSGAGSRVESGFRDENGSAVEIGMCGHTRSLVSSSAIQMSQIASTSRGGDSPTVRVVIYLASPLPMIASNSSNQFTITLIDVTVEACTSSRPRTRCSSAERSQDALLKLPSR